MLFFKNYNIFFILTILEILFLFKLDIISNNNYFFTWLLISIALYLYNILDIIKTNPILGLIVKNNNSNKKPILTLKERFTKPKNIAYLAFLILNFLLYLIS